ncbi:RidA family protein [Pelagibius sp. CAU 1746]|uniref:RidA family protein n=1 Tax=Pelagibius sp. CAU 1746 TaxID=3140370 RepID=UPI00325AAA39
MLISASSDASAQETKATTAIVNPAGLYDPAPNGYSHAVVATGGSRIAYIAGQGGEDANGKLSPQFSDQVEQAYANLRSALDAVGAKPGQVTKITTYVVDYDQSKLGAMTEAVKQTFGDALPAQTLVPVPRLALDGMLFEVDAVAVLD